MGYYKELDIEIQEQKRYIYVVMDAETDEWSTSPILGYDVVTDAEEMCLALAEEAFYECYCCSTHTDDYETEFYPKNYPVTLNQMAFYVAKIPCYFVEV